MRASILVAVGVGAAVGILTTLLGGDRTPTDVVVTAPVQVVASEADSDAELGSRIRRAVTAAEQAEDDLWLKVVMRLMVLDDDLRAEILAGIRAGYRGREGAVAYSVNAVKNGRRAIGVVNLIVMPPAPPGGPDARYTRLAEHERWHAWINDEIARRLGEDLVDQLADVPRKERGDRVRESLTAQQRLAQVEYEIATLQGTEGDDRAEARKAVDGVVAAFR